MIEQHYDYLLLLSSVPWNLGIAYKAKKAMEDEDSNFVFKFLLQKLELFIVPSGLQVGDKE